MKFSFKKIATILTSAVMLGSTVGLAAAASYPAPFVTSGTANGAVVAGNAAATSDWAAAIDLGQSLSALSTSSSSSTSGSVTGEAAALFTSGTKLYLNDTLNLVRSSLTDSQLPTVLKDGSFSGNVDATYTQTIDVGFNPRVTFAKQPSTSNDPLYALTTSTSAANYIYNSSVTFS